jgi:hypothetical protein
LPVILNPLFLKRGFLLLPAVDLIDYQKFQETG